MKNFPSISFINKKYKGLIFKVLMDNGVPFHDVDLLTNDILLIINDKKDSCNITNIVSWIWTISKNKAIDYIRSKKRNYTLTSVDSIINDNYNFVEYDNPESILISNESPNLIDENIQSIKKEILCLTPVYKKTMMDYYLNNINTTQLAIKYGVSKGSVKGNLHKSRKIIRKKLNIEL